MPTIFVLRGVRFMIYPNDHDPPHVHAWGADYEVVVLLGNCEEIYPALREVRGKPSQAALRMILLAAHERCPQLFEAWRIHHGYQG